MGGLWIMKIDFIEEMPIDGKGKSPYTLRYERGTKTFIVKYNDEIYKGTKVILNNEIITRYEANLRRIYKFIKDCLDNHRPINIPF